MGTKITAMQEWFLKRLKNSIGVLQYKWTFYNLIFYNPTMLWKKELPILISLHGGSFFIPLRDRTVNDTIIVG